VKLSRNRDPKVSIILPNFNSEKTIETTIKSILNQSYKNWELIIVDDNSSIKTKKILPKFKKIKKIKIINLKKNMGAGYCRNLAIKKSKSQFCAFIDSDDVWEKNKLKTQINFMIKNNYHFTYTYYYTINENDKFIKSILTPKKFNFESFIKNTSIATSTMILDRTLIKKTKFPNTKICEDYFFKCQILKKIDYAICYPFFLTKYRIRKNSLQSNRFKNLIWMWKINKNLNHFNSFKNFISLLFVSINSLKKYGLR